MKFYEHELYIEDVKRVASLPLPWEKLQDSSVLITGASGMMGSFLTDVLMERNHSRGMNCRVYAVCRNAEKARGRFALYGNEILFEILSADINKPGSLVKADHADYIFHLASNTHPMLYSTDPIGTILTNTVGLINILDFAAEKHAKRVAFASSNEIYGENRGDVEFFDESYCGYINSNTLRAGYTESKRCGEALCQAYIHQKNLDIVIPRLTRSYGPTMLMSDTKAISQFIRKAVAGEDIVLKSEGTQYYSYTYAADAASGLLTVLLEGKCGEAYNIADEESDIMLKDLAGLIAEDAGKKVVFDLPDETERAGYSTATKARLDGSKLKALGWAPEYDIAGGMARTLKILRESE